MADSAQPRLPTKRRWSIIVLAKNTGCGAGDVGDARLFRSIQAERE
jgi:hypothetical protein